MSTGKFVAILLAMVAAGFLGWLGLTIGMETLACQFGWTQMLTLHDYGELGTCLQLNGWMMIGNFCLVMGLFFAAVLKVGEIDRQATMAEIQRQSDAGILAI